MWKSLKSKLSVLWRNGPMQKSFIRHPIDLFQGVKFGAKATSNSKHKKDASRYALGKTVHARLVNGPELNILLLGIPFLISFGVGHAGNHHAYKKKKKANAKAA